MGEPAREIATVEPERMPAVTPMQMLQIAIEKGASLDALERLMSLQERWEANEARKAFVVAKAAFKAEAPSIVKNKHVGFLSKRTESSTDYDHATLDNVADTLSPILSKNGLSYSWQTEQLEGGMIKVTCILEHVLGHRETVSLKAGADTSGNKNSIQAIGSTATFLSRYTLLLACGIATKGQDDDGLGGEGESISPEQKQVLVDLMREVNAETAAFLKYMGVANLDVLPASRFEQAKAALNKKRKG